jgi:hypothetical protein
LRLPRQVVPRTAWTFVDIEHIAMAALFGLRLFHGGVEPFATTLTVAALCERSGHRVTLVATVTAFCFCMVNRAGDVPQQLFNVLACYLAAVQQGLNLVHPPFIRGVCIRGMGHGSLLGGGRSSRRVGGATVRSESGFSDVDTHKPTEQMSV